MVASVSGRTLVLAAAIVASLSLFAAVFPAGAAAADHYPASLEESIHLHGSHGYAIAIEVVDHQFVSVEAKKRVGSHGQVSVSYLDNTKSGPGNRLDVKLPGVGHVDADFVPESSRSVPVRPGCKGAGSTVEHGFFVGMIALRGERDYTRVHRTKVAGKVTRSAPRVCAHPDRLTSRAVERRARAAGRIVFLFTANHLSAPILEAARLEGPGKDGRRAEHFTAYADAKRGELSILSIATVGAPTTAGYSIEAGAEPPEEATLRPPAPFSGSATFRLLAPTRDSWTGDLAVRMPNFGLLPLTGRGLNVGLCEAGTCTETFAPGEVFVEPSPVEMEEEAIESTAPPSHR
jgi:hypothetical protein